MEQLYKITGLSGESINGGNGQWHRPKGRPGKWMDEILPVVLCKSGYHLVDLENLVQWIKRNDCVIWEAEGRGKSVNDGNKTVFSQARIVRKVGVVNKALLQEFACDVAEHVLWIWEKKYPEDRRVKNCIETTRRFLKNEATLEELIKARKGPYAAYAAAYTAANTAAADAYAYANTAAAYAAYAAAYAYANTAAAAAATADAAAAAAAYTAANAAAAYAAYAAAYYNVRTTEHRWQGNHLLHLLSQ